MPKILKLIIIKFGIISKEIIPNLNCRGVKSSMKDPIKVIQIVLDKYILY